MKKIISIVFVAAIAVAAAWNFAQSKAETVLSDLALENVEALAGCEVSASGSNKGVCASMIGGGDACIYGTGSPVCSGNF
jgi:hypothetical protein